MFSLKNKIFIITGGNSGIGLFISKALIKLGSKIIRIDLKFKKIPKSLDYICDISNPDDVKVVFSKIKKNYKKIDGLVNCAGITINTKLPYQDINSFNSTLNTNLTGAYLVISECVKILKKKSSVVNITSLGSVLSFPNNPSYQASKAGLRQLTKSFARDFSHFGIRFNNICPGYIKTKMTIRSFENKNKRKVRSDRMLLPRWGKPSDIVGPVIFLLSDASSYITGSDIYVDGGWTSKGI